MKRKQILIETLVGLFSFAVLAALFMLTVVLSRDAFLRKAHPVEILFQDVMGLRVGDSVNSRGVVVGKVQGMELRPDGVLVRAELTQDVPLRSDYKVEVLSSSVLGGRYLNLDPGTPDAAVLDEIPDRLTGAPTTDLIDSATRLVQDIRTALNDGIIDDFKATMSNIRNISDDIATGDGTLAKLIHDGQLHDDIAATVADLRGIGDRLAAGEGTLGKLLSSDDQLYTDLSAAIADLRTIGDRLAAGEGTLGKLLSSDDQMYQDLSATISSLRGVGERLEAGEGTLGKIITDEELYLELRAILREGRAAIDDLRETSPITTFSSVFFGIF